MERTLFSRQISEKFQKGRRLRAKYMYIGADHITHLSRKRDRGKGRFKGHKTFVSPPRRHSPDWYIAFSRGRGILN